jgi:uncharacterized protein YbjT (DUF2867 family)
MQTEYERTPEEESFYQLLDATRGQLSGEALELIGIAQNEAYKYNLVRNYAYQVHEYYMAMEDMVRLSGEISDKEREIIAAIGRSATAAAAAIDPDDERPAGHKVCGGDVRDYYEMVSGMIESALEPKSVREREEARVRLWMDHADFEARIRLNSARARAQGPQDLDEYPF